MALAYSGETSFQQPCRSALTLRVSPWLISSSDTKYAKRLRLVNKARYVEVDISIAIEFS